MTVRTSGLALAILMIAGTAGAALAAAIPGTALRTMFAGADLRFSEGAFEPKHHLWRFSADGTLTGVYTQFKTLVPQTSYYIEENDTGRWSVEGAAVCVQWRNWYRGAKRCFAVERLEGKWVRLTHTTSGASYKGTLAPRNGG